MKDPKILTSPSILACDFLHLEDEIRRAVASGADLLHADVMDGMFVPNMSFGFDVIRLIHGITDVPLDVHMMTSAPQKYIEVLRDTGAAIVTIHNDIGLSDEELIEALKKIRECGMKPAISLRPKIPAESVFPLLPYVDMVLVMTVEPGFGGQKFMADMLPKIAAIRKEIDRQGRDIDIQVDGGINEENAARTAAAGANVFVVGTASFRAPDMKAALDGVKAAAEASFGKDL
ncbi:MAG: ribulose-phosphate 3-epimerase [Clostridia bacterium]|nr:ribulose-phosphate 3-epimerase [Clostridia bacterium]